MRDTFLLPFQALPQLGTFRGPALELVEELSFSSWFKGGPPLTCWRSSMKRENFALSLSMSGAAAILRVTLQPLCRGREAPPARQVGH